VANVTLKLPDPGLFVQVSPGDTEIYYSAREMRHLLGSVFTSDGVTGPADLKVDQAADIVTNPWNIKVAAGGAVLTYQATGQRWYAHYDGGEIDCKTINTSPSATRTHAVYLAMYDKAITGNRYGAELFVGEDIGSGAPAPAAAVGYTRLATFTVTNGQTNIKTANIADTRAFATGRAPAMAAGQVNLANPSGGPVGPVRVNFPIGRFTASPRIALTQANIPQSSQLYLWKASNVGPTGFDLYAVYATGESMPPVAQTMFIHWIAVADQ
jgi:hypothetical protein